MSFDIMSQITLVGPALPEPFVRHDLEKELTKRKLLPRPTGKEAEEFQAAWAAYVRKLRELVSRGGAVRVRNHVLDPLLTRLGYSRWEESSDVTTREGAEAGGRLLVAADGTRLRTWATDFDEDLDAPARRGRAYRFSHLRSAQRVLLATGERMGLLTNGVELRLLLSDPARPDSQLILALDPYWKRPRDLPDTYRLLLALASPAGVAALPELVEKAREQQSRVTKDLRVQARRAVQRFLQEVLDHPANRTTLETLPDKAALARALWREGLITIYRLLFALKLESSDDSAKAFSFASTSLWRNSFSPSVALARFARAVLDDGQETGSLLEEGVRTLFRMFAEGLQSTELSIKPLGGALFAPNTTPWLTRLCWGERAVAHLLDQLLWTGQQRGNAARARVHYGPLDVEDLGRVYEALLELEPGISTAAMCRLRRSKLEVVVPFAQGEPYRPASPALAADMADGIVDVAEEDTDSAGDEEEDDSANRKASKVDWIEAIPPNQFYLRVGLGRKASGSFYTPHSFVRFLVQEVLGPLVEERSPQHDPQPAAILLLKVLDDAMGSGHFLVEAARFLGEQLYEACRLCDELALAAEERAAQAKTESERTVALTQAAAYRQRVADLPDPDDELVKYLPSRAPEGEGSGLSQQKALALCKRLVAVHCLYGVDKNPLAVELAKLALWLECHAEGMPLTFLDHRLVVGDALTGPFFPHLLTYPSNQASLEGLYSQGLRDRFTALLADALRHVRDLEAGVGVTVAELTAKAAAKARLDRALAPLRIVAAAWAGGVMLGKAACDDLAYKWLVEQVAATGSLPATLATYPRLCAMIARGLGVEDIPPDGDGLLALLFSDGCVPALPFDLVFPEVFFPDGDVTVRYGFHAILGNPPWDRMLPADKEFFAAYDFNILSATTKRERNAAQTRLLQAPLVRQRYDRYIESFRADERILDLLYHYQVVLIDGKRTIGKQDAFRVFMERNAQLLAPTGITGIVVPSAFHANEGATGVRRLYLEEMGLRCCYSFENRNKLFEIHSSFKFALVVANRQGPTDEFKCAFYLHDDEWLFNYSSRSEQTEILEYTLSFVRRTGGEHLSFLELRSLKDLEITGECFNLRETFAQFCKKNRILLSRELNMTEDSWRFQRTEEVVKNDPRIPKLHTELVRNGNIILVEGKTFWQYDDQWGDPPRFIVPINNLRDRHHFVHASQFYRFAFRDIASSTNERTVVFALLTPGVVFGDTAKAPERAPYNRSNQIALSTIGVANSFLFDFLTRLRVSSHVNLYILQSMPFPYFNQTFIAHASLRLTCNHSGYGPLWREQLDDTWREATPPFTWPVLAGNDARWAVRAAIDAVVAQAYGLNRDQYAHVLSTFSHSSYRQAPALCLARFDELTAIGLEAFTRKYDPYWDIPLNESLPQPVIELPLAGPEETNQPMSQLGLGI
jgi:hypothetical protein